MDIRANINFALEGKFKVDIYDKNGNFLSTSDWFNNFITPTGLNYIYKYNFADCFRYLSIGSGGATPNSGNKDNKTGTTGLASPTSFIFTNLDSGINPDITGQSGVWYVPGSNFAGTLSGQYIGPWGYAEESASIFENLSGPSLYRTWRVPFYDSILTGYGDAGLTLSEFMVSPSSGTDPIGNKAFSRVRKTIIIPDQTYAYISYQLGIRLSNTDIQIFTGKTFNTGNAEVTYEKNEVEQWSNLSGYYRQTYHGLAGISSNGSTKISKHGAIMEPSWTGMDQCRFYLSPDNGQFNVNVTGGAQNSESDAYKADGLLKFITMSDPFTSSDLPVNIRYRGQAPYLYDYTTQNENILSLATKDDYTSFSNATPGVNRYATGIYTGEVDRGNKVLFSTRGMNMPIQTGLFTGRTRVLTRRHSFLPANSLGKNTRFGSLVYAFKTDGADYYPMIDCMFFDSSGQHIMAHYREVTGIYMTNRGSGILDAETYTIPTLDKPFTHRTFQGPGTGDWNSHPAIP